MSTYVAVAVPLILLALTVPWCLRMVRSRTAEPALNRIGSLVAVTALAVLGVVVMGTGAVPLWSWYPTAAAVAVGATALGVRWPTLVGPGPAEHRIRTVVSLVIEGALLVLVMYGFLH